ncbi:MAG: hypothetical protein OEZ16_12125 [Chromatiales bacterium]|nr:hypothetical protein [Chromatiales bacterium]
MAKGKGQIGLSVAKRSTPASSSFNYRSTPMESWVHDLPMGNVGATAKLVYNALHEVNRLDISWRERQRFLELLREPITYVEQQLQQRYAGVSFPLPTKSRQIAELATTLSHEMAVGYKTAIEDMLGSSFLKRDNKALTELIHRAIHYISCVLLTCYRTYAPHSSDCWFELHLLYLHAEHKNVHTNSVTDPWNEKLPKSSIARLYKQILLLALASPYRMRQGEAQATYHVLARWAAHADIIPYNDPSAAEALFVVHLDSDDAPDFQAFNHRDCNTELCRLVDTRQLSHVLQDEKAYYGARGNVEEGISSDLLNRLIRCWGVAPKRSFTRNDKDAYIDVVVGLSTVHRALAIDMGFDDQLQNKSRYSSKTVAGVSQPTNRDVWNAFSKESLGQQYNNYKHLTEEPKPPTPKQPVERLRWHIRNESAGGYRLAIEDGDNAKVQVGELLGLWPRHNINTCEIGVIRWMRQPAEGGLELGVQVVGPDAKPVTLRAARLSSKGPEYQPALMLPEVASIGLPATLLTPILLFESGAELRLHHGNHEMRITLARRCQQAASFSQFIFKTLDEIELPAPSQENPADQDSGTASGLSINWDDL